MSQSLIQSQLTIESLPTGWKLQKLDRWFAKYIGFLAMSVAVASFPLNAFGQNGSGLEVEIELENPIDQPQGEDDDDYSWFGTMMTFPAEPDAFRFSSYSKPSEKPQPEIFVEGKIESAGVRWSEQKQSKRSAVARDSEIAVTISATNEKALLEGADFTIEVANLSGKVQRESIGLQIPDSMTLVSANRVPQVDQTIRTVFFQVEDLAPGDRDTITYRVKTTVPGSQKQTVTISPTNRPRIRIELHTDFETR